MGNQAPQWISGVLYGTGKLSAQGLGAELEAIVRLDVARMEWEIAFPKQPKVHELRAQVFGFQSGSLCDIRLHQAEGASALVIDRLEFTRLGGIAALEEASFKGWEGSGGLPIDAHRTLWLLKPGTADSNEVVVQCMDLAPVYATRYQLPRMDRELAFIHEQELRLRSGSVVQLHVEQALDRTYLSVSSAQHWDADKSCVLLALELFVGFRMEEIQQRQVGSYSFFHQSNHLMKKESLVWLKLPTVQTLQRIITRLGQLAPPELERFSLACQYHLLARSSGAVAEIRFIMEMTLIEMLDGVGSMTYPTTARMLGISDQAAKFLQKMRNKLLHQEGSLSASVQPVLQEIFNPRPPQKGPAKPPLNSLQQVQWLEQVQRDLGLNVPVRDPNFPPYLGLRLSERINVAIWNFLGVQPHELAYNSLVQWHEQGRRAERPWPKVIFPEFAHLPLPEVETEGEVEGADGAEQ